MINLEALTIDELLILKQNVQDTINTKVREKYNRFEIVNRNGNISFELSQLLPECNIRYNVVKTELPHCCGTIVVHVPKNHKKYKEYLKIIEKYNDI